jgi:hypothetical protein
VAIVNDIKIMLVPSDGIFIENDVALLVTVARPVDPAAIATVKVAPDGLEIVYPPLGKGTNILKNVFADDATRVPLESVATAGAPITEIDIS